jgi:type I restriction enzyme S subunit
MSASSRTWPVVSLEEVAEMCLGKMLDSKKNKGRPQPYLRNPNVRWFDVDLRDVQLMPFEEHEDERYGLSAGDVVVCEGGEAGRAAIWDGRVANMKFQKAIHRVRCGPRLNSRFLVHRLMADYFSGRLADYYTGATIKHLTGQDLARYRIPLPPLPEQQRIAEILDTAAALRAKRRTAIAQLDTLTQSIFLDMFGDPAANPKRWPIVTIGHLLESATYGTSEKSGENGRWPVLRMNNITSSGRMDLADLKFMDLDAKELDRYLVHAGDVLFNRTNSPDLVGKSAIYRHPEPMAYAGYLIRLRTNEEADPEYLAAFLNTTYAKRVLRGMCKSIIGMANINATELQSIRIPKPEIGLQQEFGRCLDVVENSRSRHEAALTDTDNLFVSLQYRAFEGEL